MAENGNWSRYLALLNHLGPELDARWIETNGSPTSSANRTSSHASDSQLEKEELHSDEVEYKKKNENKKKTTVNRRVIDEQPPVMPEPMRQKIQELMGDIRDNNDIKAGPTWLQSKVLQETDIGHHANRLFLPNKSKLDELLSTEEGERLGVDKDKGKNGGMRSGIVDANGVFWPLDFRMWSSLHKYVLAKEWGQFVAEHQLKAKDLAQIWCFRDANWKFCFAMNVVSKQEEDDNNESSCNGGIADDDQSGRSKRRRSSNGNCNGEGSPSSAKKNKIL